MDFPGLGLVSVSGFERPWLFVLLLVPLGLAVLYVWASIRRRRRLQRFATTEMLPSVAPRRASGWRHVPMAVMLVALALLTVALTGPSRDVKVPRNRAVIMLAIDVSQSMRATDEPPSRLEAAKAAAKRFAQQLTPGVNLGLIGFSGTVNVLVSPTPDHAATIAALDNLRPGDSTAIGEALSSALQSVATVAAVLSSGDAPPPARIVLLSDGKENKPEHPDNSGTPRGAYVAARSAKDQGVPISTIAFGTKEGTVELADQLVPVPVDDSMLKRIAELSGGQSYRASNVDDLNRSYDAVQQQVGYQTIQGPASAGWLRLGVLVATIGMVLALRLNRRLPA
ncbi:VWA domain-containing protein [Mycobacterium vicinigordonae]|uniref:VWA domain-containing protein n=1 Tax=Mycobacterium vicinigordonae TaxID=1719132 RepID=A0A7D6I5J4_9MYCO|nr:VWA domain-containing protein [Mycobacterium vicinigordonae]QLL06296.1 VWA domain-containing protein [Mycobacterium vicinigordonae]